MIHIQDHQMKEGGILEGTNIKRTSNNMISGVKKGKESHTLKLHPAEMKLLQVISAIEFGEIEGLRIENGLPAYYKGARKTCKLA